MTPEFPRPHRIDQIGAAESTVGIQASAEERAALARRFELIAIDRLEVHFALRRIAAGVLAHGHISAAVTQSCSVTGEPVPADIEEEFAIRFVPEANAGETQDEVELSEEDLDTVFYAGNAIDLGEAAAETLALALDPFPRSPNAASVLAKAGVIGEDEAGPFGALATLKDKLKKS
jgi:uncharacterized metal-binding protein YceD (DUF177 family)